LEITIDAKQRLHEDNFLEYLQSQYEATWAPNGRSRRGAVTVREIDSKSHDLIQVCDLLSGAYHTTLTRAHCGTRKAELASEIWLPTHCRTWEFNFARARK